MTITSILIIFLLIIFSNIFTSLNITKLDLRKRSTDDSGIVRFHTEGSIFPLCSDNISLIEVNVLCRQMGLGMAKTMNQYPIPIGIKKLIFVDKPKCFGHEDSIVECSERLHIGLLNKCKASVVGVRCVEALPNLVPDINSVESSVYVQIEPLYQLTCAIEENCLNPKAISTYRGWTQEQLYNINDTSKYWRKLLRFSSIIKNDGNAVFEPHFSIREWEWHTCHGHFHSMSTFAIYQILAIGTTSVKDEKGILLAGHKASFCLEDNVCMDGVKPFYRCSRVKTETGSQGITPGCTDTYLHNIDCQWIDVTDLPYGRYLFRLVVNPDILVAESNYYDNGIACELFYFSYYTGFHYCHFVHPLVIW